MATDVGGEPVARGEEPSAPSAAPAAERGGDAAVDVPASADDPATPLSQGVVEVSAPAPAKKKLAVRIRLKRRKVDPGVAAHGAAKARASGALGRSSSGGVGGAAAPAAPAEGDAVVQEDEESGRLPRGRAVRATIPLPPTRWSPGDPAPVPALISFRRLLAEQRFSDDDEPEDSLDAKAVAAATRKDVPPPAAAPEPSLAEIGKKDRLGEIIRSMENRLARQGVLAAPSTILGRKSRSEEDFYDAMDGMIDDADLEELNFADEQRAQKDRAALRRAASNFSTGSASGGAASGALVEGDAVASEGGSGDEAAWGEGGAAAELDLSAFRLAGPEVSGTSAESSSDSDDCRRDVEGEGEDGLETSEGRSWQEQLASLGNEVTLVNMGTSMKSLPADGQSVDGEVEALRAVFADCCSAVANAADHGERGVLQDAVESALRELLRRLPYLVKSACCALDLQPLRWRLIGLEVRLHEDTSMRTKLAELFPWSAQEEVAWARYAWRLLRAAAPELKPRSFVHHWTAAGREPQRDMLSKAKARSLGRLGGGGALPGARAALDVALREWGASQQATEDRARLLAALKPLEPVVSGLYLCWSRQRFWEEQRKLHRFAVHCKNHLDSSTFRPFGVFVVAHLKAQLGLVVPVDALVSLLRRQAAQSSAAPADPGASARAPGKLVSVPMRLPTAIQIVVPRNSATGHELVVDCTLRSVKSRSEQTVVLGSGSASRECRSLDQAVRAVLADLQAKHGKPATWPSLAWEVLGKKDGAWSCARVRYTTKTFALAFLLNKAHARGVPPFINPPDAQCACPVLPPVALHSLRTRTQGAVAAAAAAAPAAGRGAGAASRGRGGASVAGRGSAAKAGAAKGGAKRAAVPKKAVVAPAKRSAPKASAAAGAKAAPGTGAKGGGGAAAEAVTTFTPGKKVKYLERGTWYSGKVKEVRGEQIVVETIGAGSVSSVLLPRERVQPLVASRTKAPGPKAPGAAIIAVEDSD